MNKLILIIGIQFFSVNLFSQADSISFKLPELKIYQFENGKEVVYEFENSPNIFSIKDSILIADPEKYKYKVNLADINKITLIRSSNILPGIVVGFAVGGLIGSLLSGGFHGTPSTGERIEGALLIGSIVSLVVGSISFIIDHDNEFDLSKYDLPSKRKFLLKTLTDHKIK